MRIFSAKDDKIAIECDKCKKIYNFSKEYFSSITGKGCVPNVDIICPNCKNKVPAGTLIEGNAQPYNAKSDSPSNDNNKKPGCGCLSGIIVLIVIIILAIISSGTESEFEKAGKDFDNWINDDPRTWSDAEKEYFEFFWEQVIEN